MIVLRLFLTWPLALLFLVVSEIRRNIFRLFVRPLAVDAVVISVGNLTSGGTGKTPFVKALIAQLMKMGKRVAVVSRPYKAKANEVMRVRPDELGAAELYGDEPVLLAQAYPDIEVWVGPKKWQTAAAVVEKSRPDVILVDDGFQHLKLQRDFDFVLLDATEPLWHYLPLPMGYARDAIWRLRGADLLVLSKFQLATRAQQERLEWLFKDRSALVRMDYRIKRFRDSEGRVVSSAGRPKVLLVSGIGRPQTFEKLVRDAGLEVVGHEIFADHHAFSEAEVRNLERKADQKGAGFILTTEKDAVRLSIRNPRKFLIAELETEIPGLEKKIYETLN